MRGEVEKIDEVSVKQKQNIALELRRERRTGFEPATSSLARKHSTTELPPRTFYASKVFQRQARLLRVCEKQDASAAYH